MPGGSIGVPPGPRNSPRLRRARQPGKRCPVVEDLSRFASQVDIDDGFASFIALFRGPHIDDERHFEELLWEQLREVHAADEQPWAPDVSDDPDDPHFAFSAAGTAYFVVGLHPKASRDARRAAVPTLVFNLHAQFEELRTSGAFPRMRDLIRARDEALQGQVNPMVSDHGQTSEARQYSGRQVSSDWQAPFEAGPEATHDQSDDADSGSIAGYLSEPPRAADRHRVPASGRGPADRRGPHRRPGQRLLRPVGRRPRGVAVLRSQHRLRQYDLPQHRPRALQQPQPTDGHHRGRHLRAFTTSC